MLLLHVQLSAVPVSICCSICYWQWADLWLYTAQAPWSEFMQDEAAQNNVTRHFCTEALQIEVPRERMSDR